MRLENSYKNVFEGGGGGGGLFFLKFLIKILIALKKFVICILCVFVCVC